MIYCVCTPLKSEGLEIVEGALSDGLYTRHAIEPDEIPGFEHCLTGAGDLLTIPSEGAGHVLREGLAIVESYKVHRRNRFDRPRFDVRNVDATFHGCGAGTRESME